MNIEREWSMPSRYTFGIQPISDLLEEEVGDGLWIDPFSGPATVADITNDLNPEYDTDYTMRATDFLQEFDDEQIDGGVLLDPPYSPRQVSECYNDVGIETSKADTQAKFWSEIRDEASRVLSVGSKAISFGWNSVGVSASRGFEKDRVLLVCHGGNHNDTICTVETKTHDVVVTDRPEPKAASEVSW